MCRTLPGKKLMPRTLVCTPSESGRNCCHSFLSGYGPSGISCCNGSDRKSDLLPFHITPAEYRPPDRRFVPSAISGVPACSLAALLGDSPSPSRCHSLFAVPSTVACPHGAWHLIRPAGRTCDFLGSGGSLDTRCKRDACRCHPPLCILLVWASNLAGEKGVRILEFGQIARQRGQIDCLPVEI